MPRAIGPRPGDPVTGIVSYTLSASEEFTLLGLSVLFTGSPHFTPNVGLIDCRAVGGGVIYRQVLGILYDSPVFFSLAAGAEPFQESAETSTVDFPQNEASGLRMAWVTERLAPVPLTPGCTIYAFAIQVTQPPGVDPLDWVDPDAVPSDLHLWVEDTNAVVLSEIGNPLLIGAVG